MKLPFSRGSKAKKGGAVRRPAPAGPPPLLQNGQFHEQPAGNGYVDPNNGYDDQSGWGQPQEYESYQVAGPNQYDNYQEPVGEGWLTVEHVQKSYKKRKVVRGVSLAVRRGESVGLLGPNGAGKTTVFYMITGLVPADAGRISIDGADVTRLPMYQRARLGIGYLPQEASIFRGLTVEQNLMAVLELTEKSAKKRREKLDSLLEEFRITRLRKSPSIALSGGERRRCEIARALASDPSFILLDEPFAGIDPIAVKDIQELVRHLTDRGIGVLITDHSVRETLSLIDRAYIIYDGQVLTHGNPSEIIANEEVRRVYLGDMFVNGT
ncbi:MAG: LPS export ABC transporter ATP-binding protein [Hyphomicrobiaceae bacterium]|nr:LPS export ABC transporter ATP-binding protein [Hyphomicrobiaceae bacterium]